MNQGRHHLVFSCQVFRIDDDMGRSLKFPVAIPLFNLRRLLCSPHVDEFANRAASAITVCTFQTHCNIDKPCMYARAVGAFPRTTQPCANHAGSNKACFVETSAESRCFTVASRRLSLCSLRSLLHAICLAGFHGYSCHAPGPTSIPVAIPGLC